VVVQDSVTIVDTVSGVGSDTHELTGLLALAPSSL
jgi:hypothetical protein